MPVRKFYILNVNIEESTWHENKIKVTKKKNRNASLDTGRLFLL